MGVILPAMKISPRELREAQIPSKAFGFNQDVVDALLERAADTIEGLIEENRQLFEALERMRNEGSAEPMVDPFAGVQSAPEPAPEPEQVPVAPAASVDESLLMAQVSEKEELINKTLLLAQKTADETLKTAKDQADELVAAAQANAEELVAKAKEQADSLSGEAKEKAEKELAEAQEKAQNMVAAAQGQADSLMADAQAKADQIHKEERDKFVALVTKLKAERAQLLSDIEILQKFDSEHRAKLREVVEKDLEILVEREKVDVGEVPVLPVVDEFDEFDEIDSIEIEEVASATQSQVEPPASFDEMIAEPEEVIEDIEEDEILVSEAIEIEEDVVEPATETASYTNEDPFAAFVDSPSVVSPAGLEDDEPQVVAPAGDTVESSDSNDAFKPGKTNNQSHQENLDDDDFFASLREAVQDDAPLGPSDEEDDGGRFKGLFKK